MMTAAAVAAVIACRAQTPAFPGAEGFGRYTTGGRGGRIVRVTNLNDSGPGSLREAVAGDESKTVVFDVGGVIALESDLTIGGNTTIMGQTAPGQGITVRYYTVLYGGDNIIVRFMRFRRGEERNINDGADATWTCRRRNIILDHCSMSWSIDEVASFYDNRDFTMQWCTVAEALCNAGHNKGSHGYGGIWGGKGASFHHNLLAHLNNRSPRFNGARYAWEGYDKTKFANTVTAERVDFRNCVVYNWGGGGCYGGPGGGFVNMVNNYYKAGPGTAHRDRVTQCSTCGPGNGGPGSTVTERFLREHHLDELPQLWNVLKGDMSFVGPRPERKYYIDKIMAVAPEYELIYLMRPGLTSEATLYNGYTDTMEKMLIRLRMDLHYLETRSLRLDLSIILRTALSIVSGKKF